MLRKLLIIPLLVTLIVPLQALYAFDSLDSFCATYQNWNPLGRGSVSTEDGLKIQYSKRIDPGIQKPATLPDPGSWIPVVTPYGVDWQMDLSVNGKSSFLKAYMNKVTDFFAPDTLEMMAIIGAVWLLRQNTQSKAIADTMIDYIRTAQLADQTTTTLYNHRFEILNSINDDDKGEGAPHDADSATAGAQKNIRGIENWALNRINHKRSLFEPDDEPAVKLLNYLNSTDPADYKCNLPEIDGKRLAAISSVKDIYCANLVNKRVSAIRGVYSVVYDIRAEYRNYALYKVSRQGDANAAAVFEKNPRVAAVLSGKKIPATLDIARHSDNPDKFMEDGEYRFMKASVGEKINNAIAILKDFSPYINLHEAKNALNAVVNELIQAQSLYKDGYYTVEGK